MKKFGKFLSSLILFLMTLCVIFALLVMVVGERDEDGTVHFMGYQVRKVLTDSMAESKKTDVSKYSVKSIPAGSIIVIQQVPEGEISADKWYDSLKVGDVLTFRYRYDNKSFVITHRIVAIEENENGGYTISLEGDNKNSQGTQLKQVIDTSDPDSGSYVIGKVRYAILFPRLVLKALKSPVSILMIIVFGGSIVAIINLLTSCAADKKKQPNKTKKAPAKTQAPKKKVKLDRLPDDIEYDENGWAKY